MATHRGVAASSSWGVVLGGSISLYKCSFKKMGGDLVEEQPDFLSKRVPAVPDEHGHEDPLYDGDYEGERIFA